MYGIAVQQLIVLQPLSLLHTFCGLKIMLNITTTSMGKTNRML